ncbi:AMP-binding protein [Anaeromassilibacillus sp. An200]|uniref:AMP-binding protein n=1 Tax=Anaeromassilibacillus sp. An200 TaxID=1965587 RepID=UPI0023B8AE80|nr:AMP-binding protein [Anaeromassilibacillus sp. An200]
MAESLLPLSKGIRILLANEEQAKIQPELNDLLQTHSTDVLMTTPTKMKSLIADNTKTDYMKQLKLIVLGGEELAVQLVEKLRKLTSADIYNIYGPTETTVCDKCVCNKC